MRSWKLTAWCALIGAVLCWSAPPALAQRERLSPDDYDAVYSRWPKVQKTSTGIRYLIEKKGAGTPPKPGDMVSVIYTGKLLDGTQFDANLDPKKPFRFRLGRGVVIQGWDQILQKMKPGEKRLIIVPSELAYGDIGQPPTIPRAATLVFDVELLKVEREP